MTSRPTATPQAEIEVKTPMERVVSADFFLMAFNAERALSEGKRFVNLACGHKAYTGAFTRCICLRCTEMFRRSLDGRGEDYIGFRAGIVRDEMAWSDDPCRPFNEPTDLSGKFLRDP